MSERYQLLPLFASSKLPSEHGNGKFIKKTLTRGSHYHVWVPGGEFYPMDQLPEFHDGGHQLNPDWSFQLSSIIRHKDRSWRCLFHSCTIQRRPWLKLRFGQFVLLAIKKMFMDFPRRNDWIWLDCLLAVFQMCILTSIAKNLSHIRDNGNALCLACTVAKSWFHIAATAAAEISDWLSQKINWKLVKFGKIQ